MSELVERVAKAMFEHDQLNDEAKLAEWRKDWEEGAKSYRALARVVVPVAVREEREACAKVAEDWYGLYDEAAAQISSAIRARNE